VFAITLRDKGRLASEIGKHGSMHGLVGHLARGVSHPLAAAAFDSSDFAVRHLGFAIFCAFGLRQIGGG
jgi:hypothetical protein